MTVSMVTHVVCTLLVQLLCGCARGVLGSPVLPPHLTLKSGDRDNNLYDDLPRRGWGSLRPEPSDDLPVLPLSYPDGNPNPLPKDKNMDPRRLQKILGEPYDTAYLSSVRPIESMLKPNGTYVYSVRKNGQPDGQMPPELRRLSFELPGTNKRVRIKKQRHRRRMRNYLWLYTYCPVHYRWRDLGPYFWPRWIREGSCQTRRSCSIPAGMSCRPRDTTTKTMLWWYCAKTRCRWIPIKYPLITDCQCGCQR